MNELIKVRKGEINSQQVKTVNARELHAFLESKKKFADWVKNRIEKYGFVEGVDYIVTNHQTGKRKNVKVTDYHITLDMAKELSMVERNKKGKEARQYFIECEKVAHQQKVILPDFTNPAIAARAWADEVEKGQNLERQIAHNAPKVALAESIEASTNSIKIGDYVKVISKTTGFIIGRNNFFKWLKYERLLNNQNLPYQKHIDSGWFEVRESTYEHKNSNGPRSCFTTLITGKGQVSVLDRFKKSEVFQRFLNKKAAGIANRQSVATA